MELKAYLTFPGLLKHWINQTQQIAKNKRLDIPSEMFGSKMYESVLKTFLDAKIIVIEDEPLDFIGTCFHANQGLEEKDIISPPFKNCWFEAPGEKALFSLKIIPDMGTGEIVEEISIYGMLLCELGPQLYHVYALVHYEETNAINILMCWCGTKGGEISKEMTEKLNFTTPFQITIENSFNKAIVSMLEIIHNSDIGEQRFFKTVEFKTSSGKIKHKIDSVIRIGKRSNTFSPLFGKPRVIDWSNRWWVRGHWRRLEADKTGKDRSGEYIVKGFTWITEHLNGPEHAPIKTQVRIIEAHQ